MGEDAAEFEWWETEITTERRYVQNPDNHIGVYGDESSHMVEFECEVQMPDGGYRKLYINEKGKIELEGQDKILDILDRSQKENDVVNIANRTQDSEGYEISHQTYLSEIGDYRPEQVIIQCNDRDIARINELIARMEEDAGLNDILR